MLEGMLSNHAFLCSSSHNHDEPDDTNHPVNHAIELFWAGIVIEEPETSKYK